MPCRVFKQKEDILEIVAEDKSSSRLKELSLVYLSLIAFP